MAAQVIHLLEYHNVGGLVFILHITNTNLVTAGLQRHIVYTDKVHQLNNKQSGHVSILIQYKMVTPSLVTVNLCGLQQSKEDHMAVTPSLSRSINVSLTQLFFVATRRVPLKARSLNQMLENARHGVTLYLVNFKRIGIHCIHKL